MAVSDSRRRLVLGRERPDWPRRNQAGVWAELARVVLLGQAAPRAAPADGLCEAIARNHFSAALPWGNRALRDLFPLSRSGPNRSAALVMVAAGSQRKAR